MIDRDESPRVLVVEDEADVASLTRAVLQDEGYAVRVHRTGDCLDVINSYRPHVILCDYQLPYCNGSTVLNRFRTSGVCNARFILISAAPSVDAKWRDWGADDYLAKPFDIERLISKVEQAVGDAAVWSQRGTVAAGERAS